VSPEINAIVKRTGEVVPFDRRKIANAIYKATAAVSRHDEALAEQVTENVIEALLQAYSAESSPTVEEIQDVVERVLLRSDHADVAKAFIVYRHERAKMRSRPRKASRSENLPYKAMWQALDWAVVHGCHTVDDLNRAIRDGRLGELIAAADSIYESGIEDAANYVLDRRGELRFLVVAGPSSSGKTTTTHKLAEHLERAGVHVVPLALDNYFFDLEMHPGDELGDRDFETPEALDLQLINEHLAELDEGRGVDVPVYDFKTGQRQPHTTRFEPEEGTVILLDTLHGLYEGLGSSVAEARKLRLYVETISQLKDSDGRYVRWTDIRLLRRMTRDALYRGYPPERTILHWHYVRRSELKHIIPHQARADWHLNTSLAYELPYLKLHLFHHLPAFLEQWRDDERRLDGYIRTRRIHQLLDSVEDVTDDTLVPPKSLLREFIGGSSYDVH